MPLRSIIRNIKKPDSKKGLKQLWIVGSKDSFNQIKDFIKLVYSFFEDSFDIYVYNSNKNELEDYLIDKNYILEIINPKEVNSNTPDNDKLSTSNMEYCAVDYNNFSDAYRFYENIIKKVAEQGEIKDHEIAIDVTSGNKIIAIAGAVATLKYKTRIIYLHNNNQVINLIKRMFNE
ncbi:MAG: hypothetical protein EVG15_01015 [Candidatus Acididesulfobacter diazotrophicus]|jgi:hypothetical protein|uniref:CRISPR-associated protein n=1 Tax=Candidatus Acididesulfobacter diazotrophicus TaxID=2597226 RepID=A0A519BQF2_9DELT|nr:MAG: hypothetical protein EVG15_01015 [Candidatus Acididesulfobacter diazotrophicus]